MMINKVLKPVKTDFEFTVLKSLLFGGSMISD